MHVSICRIIHKLWNNLSGALLKFGLNSAPAHVDLGSSKEFWRSSDRLLQNEGLKIFFEIKT